MGTSGVGKTAAGPGKDKSLTPVATPFTSGSFVLTSYIFSRDLDGHFALQFHANRFFEDVDTSYLARAIGGGYLFPNLRQTASDFSVILVFVGQTAEQSPT